MNQHPQYTHELGKIQHNRLKEAIRAALWKSRTTTEIYTTLNADGTTEERRTTSTNVFGDNAPEVLDFLTATLRANEPITPKNYAAVLKAIQDYTAAYNVRVIDRRESAEDLKKSRDAALERQAAEEREREEEDARIKAAGQLTKSEKIHLGIKEIAERVRAQLAQEYPQATFSVTIERYAGGSALHTRLMRWRGAPILAAPEDITADRAHRYISERGRTLEDLRKEQTRGYHQLNASFRDDYKEDCWTNGVFLTLEGYSLFKHVAEIIAYYNYDDSDSMTDYFNVNFYSHLYIGHHEKPFVYEGPATTTPRTAGATTSAAGVTLRKNEEKNGLELVFNEKPALEILEAVKAQGFRWSRFAKLWYKRYSEAAEAQARAAFVAPLQEVTP